MRYLPPDIKAKIEKLNQTIYENAQPGMIVDVYKAGTSVAALDMWYVETIREKETGLGDIAVALKRTNPDAAPTMAYEIHVDDGVVKTATKSLTNFSKSRWKDAFTVGTGTAVAIEFDGYWMQDSRKRYNLITEELPYLFWVDTTGNLYVQKWDDTTTRQLLATSVSKVAAIRGWKNVQIPTDDQGLIAAYINTSGELYYRNYAYQQDDTTIWETAQQITLPDSSTAATDINLFRTNDYRTGFAVEAGGKAYWMLTERCWAGMAVESEFITGCVKNIQITATPIQYLETGKIPEYITGKVSCVFVTMGETQSYSVENSGYLSTNQFFIEYSCPVTCHGPITDNFALVDSTNKITNVSADPNNSKRLIFTARDELVLFAALTVRFYGSYNLRAIIAPMYQPYMLNADTIEIKTDPPAVTEYLTGTVRNITVIGTRVSYSSYGENMIHGYLTGGVNSITVVATKVEDLPI